MQVNMAEVCEDDVLKEAETAKHWLALAQWHRVAW